MPLPGISRSFFRPGNAPSSSPDESDTDPSDGSEPIELAASPRRAVPIPGAAGRSDSRPGSSEHQARLADRRPAERRAEPAEPAAPLPGPASAPPGPTGAAGPQLPLHVPAMAAATASSLSAENVYNYGRDLLLHTLLEDRCLAEAVDQLASRPGNSSTTYTKEHPEVQALAAEKYRFMSMHLGSLGFMSASTPDDQLQPLRQTYRRGLDYLSNKGNGRKEPLMRNSASAVSITDSMNSLLTPPALSPAYQAGFSEMQRAIATQEMPPFLNSLATHPLLSSTRYVREFDDCGLLGRGGFGKVFLAAHKLDRKHYAVKRIELGTARMRRIRTHGSDELDGLLQEARVLAKLDHPNIVRYYSCWLEYLPRDSRRALLDSHPDESFSADASSDYHEYYTHSTRSSPRRHSHSRHSRSRRSNSRSCSRNRRHGRLSSRLGSRIDGDFDDDADDDIWEATAGVPVIFEHSDSGYPEDPKSAQRHHRIRHDGGDDDDDEHTEHDDDQGDYDDGGDDGNDEEADEVPDVFVFSPAIIRQQYRRHRRQSSATIRSITSRTSEQDEGDDADQHGGGSDDSLELVSRSPGQNHLQVISRPRTRNSYLDYSRQSPQPVSAPVQDKLALTLYIQMSYHPLTLAEYLSVGGSPPAPTTADDNRFGQHLRHCFHVEPSVRILVSILDGLDYLHSKKLVHRDLKPANIFLSFTRGRPNSSVDGNDFFHPAGGIDVSGCRQCQKCQSTALALAAVASGTTGTTDGSADGKGTDECETGPIILNARIGDFGLVTDLALQTNYALKHVGTEIYRPPAPPTVRRSSSAPVEGRPSFAGADHQLASVEEESDESGSSHKIDVYSLGIILFELLYPTFTRMERQEKISELKHSAVFPPGFACPADGDVRPTERDARVAGAIRECLVRMVARNEYERASCSEVRDRMNAVLEMLKH